MRRAQTDAKDQEKDSSGDKAEPVYDPNEINAKFKISQEWDDDLDDPESDAFAEMSNAVTAGVMEILEQDEDLAEQADFKVTIVGFT